MQVIFPLAQASKNDLGEVWAEPAISRVPSTGAGFDSWTAGRPGPLKTQMARTPGELSLGIRAIAVLDDVRQAARVADMLRPGFRRLS